VTNLSEPHEVVVIRESGPVRATVEDPTKTPWILIDEAGEQVKWGVLAYAASLPLVFESREHALAWAENDPDAKYFDLRFLTDPATITRPTGKSTR
jgi:hypothetical protein